MFLSLGRKLLVLIMVCVSIVISGCATTNTANYKLAMVSQITEDEAIGKIYIGPFKDMRKVNNLDTTILGTIRGGYGNPLSRIRDEGGADGFVSDQMIDAARKSKIIAERTPEAIGISRKNNVWSVKNSAAADRPILVGVINKLNAETGFTRGTVVNVSLEMINPATSEVIWKSELSGKDSGGLGFGLLESSTKIKEWLGETIEKAATRTLTSSDFVEALNKK